MLIQVFEFEKLHVSNFDNPSVGKKVIDKLWQFNDGNKNIYFEAIRNGVRFKNYVGVIQIANITIEILPKADKDSDGDKEQWHKVLLQMLAHCKKIKINSVSKAALKKRHHSLLDLYFELFVDEVNTLLNKGLIKKYRKQSGNITALKGQLEFSKNIEKNLIHKERFYTNYQVYDYNHLINQILFKALKVLKQISNNVSLNDKIERVLSRFPEVKEITIGKSHFNRLTPNRKTKAYEEALNIAKMILLNYSPDIKGGNENMLAILFDMNMLWEEYIYRRLAKADIKGLKVKFQNSKKFWEHKNIKPDIVLKYKEDGKTETYIIDTKWKIIDVKNPSDNDLKQMYVYNMYWNAQKSLLLYPTNQERKTEFGKFHETDQIKIENQCKLGFVNVLKEDKLNTGIANEVLEMLGLI